MPAEPTARVYYDAEDSILTRVIHPVAQPCESWERYYEVPEPLATAMAEAQAAAKAAEDAVAAWIIENGAVERADEWTDQ